MCVVPASAPLPRPTHGSRSAAVARCVGRASTCWARPVPAAGRGTAGCAGVPMPHAAERPARLPTPAAEHPVVARPIPGVRGVRWPDRGRARPRRWASARGRAGPHGNWACQPLMRCVPPPWSPHLFASALYMLVVWCTVCRRIGLSLGLFTHRLLESSYVGILRLPCIALPCVAML